METSGRRGADAGAASEDPVQRQARLAALLAEQCAWRGWDTSSGILLDVLGMAGLMLAEHDDPNDLNPATVAAILDLVETPEEGTVAPVIELAAYRAAAGLTGRS